MNIDWNWFFSSFCQSAAALIGIIGAFIISRLLGLNEKINATISQFDNLLIDFNRIKARISKRRFYWYTNMNVLYNSDIIDAIGNGEFENLSREDILKKIYEIDNSLFKIDEAAMEAFNEIYKGNSPNHRKASFGGVLSSITIPYAITNLPPAGLWDNLSSEKDAINQLEVESQTIIHQFGLNLQNLKSFIDSIRPLKIIIIMLMFSFPLTVIYPLHFMPVALNNDPMITFNPIIIFESVFTLRSLLLLIFFATIEGIFYYFLIITKQLDKRLISAINTNSDDLRNIKNYSDFFELN